MIPAVTVYTQPDCVQCDRTKKWLEDPKRGNMAGLYRVVDLADSPEDLAAVMTPDRVRAVQARWPGTRYPYWPAPQ